MRRKLSAVVVLLVLAIGGISSPGYAQEATILGTVTDSTGGVLPGVVVRAIHEASGNAVETVSDERGNYRMPVRTGAYRVTAALPGFTAATKTLELQVGAQATLNLQLTPGAQQESVTVTGEAPLVDVTQSRVSGVVDPRQVAELPINGRNYLDVTMLAPGSRVNSITDTPAAGTGNFEINLDGQQVTNTIAGASFGNPGYSKDAIAEFEFVANRFDATQGRSAGVQVNVISKSGTNTPAGSVSGYFRDSKFNAADFITGAVLPYQDQQISTTYGGPIVKDKIHFFANYEYEREPITFTYNTTYPNLNPSIYSPHREDKEGVRTDFQMSSKSHLSVRWNKYDQRFFTPGTNLTNSLTSSRHSNQLFATLTQVLSNRSINEVKGGYSGFWYNNIPYPVSSVKHPLLPDYNVVPGLVMTGVTIGQNGINPARPYEDIYSVRDDFTHTYDALGHHTLKVGGEYLGEIVQSVSCRTCMGFLQSNTRPSTALVAAMVPDPLSVESWNFNLASSLVQNYTIGIGNMTAPGNSHIIGGWAQDDWQVTPRLTVNLGVRYDLATFLFGNDTALPPFLEGNRPDDTNNWGPRLGSAFSLNDKTVIRGGFGRYYGATAAVTSWFTTFAGQVVMLSVANDGRPDFASNPFNGPLPTYEQALAKVVASSCTATSNVASCVRRAYTTISSPDEQLPYSNQASVGVQRQVTNVMSVNADYLFTGTRHDIFSRNVNLNYNPATGANYSFNDLTHLPYPEFSFVTENLSEGWSNYNGLTIAVNKRLSRRWQASGNYLLSILKDGTPAPPADFPLAEDVGRQYGLASGDQRHRAVANGIWQVGHGLQLSGLYFFGSGLRQATTYGGDLRLVGSSGNQRLRPDGTVVPRNDFVGRPVHRVDIRVQKEFRFGRARVAGLMEVFNVFNHANYGSYTTAENSPTTYGQPQQNTNVAFTPRAVQLGFRVMF